jgi:hypothetical protein
MTGTQPSRRRVLRRGVAGVATVAIAGCADAGTDPTPTETTTQPPTTTALPAPALSVDDQTTDGSQVIVAAVAIDGPGWLVIHPEADDGGPNAGAVLGRRQLSPGTDTDVTIDLDSPASTHRTLYAMLHYDDPADGEFTFPTSGDPAVTNAGGLVVTAFELTTSGDDGSS